MKHNNLINSRLFGFSSMDGWIDGNVAPIERGALYTVHGRWVLRMEHGISWKCLLVQFTPRRKKTHAPKGHGLDRITLFGRFLQKKWLGLKSPSPAVSSKGDGRASNKKFSKPIIYIDMFCFPWLFQGVSLEAFRTNDERRWPLVAPSVFF